MKQKKITVQNVGSEFPGHMITYSGHLIDLFNPDPALIEIADIAHGLAYTCRWNGHTQKYWSVAQHCAMMADQVPDDQKLKYLFHDCEEAYWGDMIRPLKQVVGQGFPSVINAMDELRKMIYNKFGIPYIDQDVMKKDSELLEWEFENVVKASRAESWNPERAEWEWLKRYNEKNT